MHKVLLLLPLVAIMLELGLSTTEHGIVALRKNKGLTARAVLVSAFLVPAIALVFIGLLGLYSELAIGLFLISVAAGPPAVLMGIAEAKGDVPLAMGLSHLLGLLTIVIAPTLTNLVAAWAGPLAETAQVNVAETIETLVLVELIPIMIGMHIRQRRPEAAERLQRTLRTIIYGLIAVVFIVMVDHHVKEITRIGLRGLIAGALSGAASALLGYGLGGPRLAARKTLALSAQGRNIGLALALLSSAFPHRANLVVIVIDFWLVRMVLNIVLGKVLAAKEDARDEDHSPLTHGDMRQRRA